jgi:hypothetical protein
MSKPEKWTPPELYKFWNAKYFRGRLPDIPVVWSKKYSTGRWRSTMGVSLLEGKTQKPVKIGLNPKYKNSFVIWAGTLMHEMIHIEQWKLPRSQELNSWWLSGRTKGCYKLD